MTIKVLSNPSIERMGEGESGVHTVVRKYYKYAKKYGIEFVDPKADSYDLVAAHAGITGSQCDVAHLHGLYFTGDYPATRWQHISNKNIVNAIRHARITTVPSNWVKEIFQRDMRFSPHVLPHGVDWDEWQHEEPVSDFVMGYAKNRAGVDVCDPTYLSTLARKLPKTRFLTTFHPDGAPDNVVVISPDGVIPYSEMKKLTQRSAVFVQAVKETFGLHALEACAAGVPIAAYNHGGVKDFVAHGVNGYLAEPGDIEDLARGVMYCMKYRKQLGENGREIAKHWTWENAVKRLYDIYEEAMYDVPPYVGVVIPVFNKQATLERAVKSVLSQTRQPERIIIVDDGSTDDSGKIGRKLAEDYGSVEYVRQNTNRGVAEARNSGVRMYGSFKYVCCIDADDAIEPKFLETCVEALEADASLHLAYTALKWVKPDGSEGISKWPGEWNFDLQLKKRNQVPTCCVFRKETFDRLGGYRSRYAPTGCGTEDAALWTQFGSSGYKCEQVSKEPLFVYSFMSGNTAQPGYNEVDWLALYPSAHDGLYPFASYKTPVNDIAHPVFQYDEPVISVVIPVGPGHANMLIDALDSVESQREFRKWEAIVVNDSGEEFPEHITKAYPYVRWLDTGGNKGPGHARNMGADKARSKFLVFLDADDMLMPDFMKSVLEAWENNPHIVYTDYLGSAIISEEEANKQRNAGKLRSWGGDGKISVVGYPTRSPERDFDCEAAQSMPRFPLYHWCLVTCLIPKAWHDEIGGFDERMDSWEDVDYHWRMAWAGKCYSRVKEELVMYRFLSGSRRSAASADTEEGIQTGRKLLRYIDKKKESIAMSPCTGCGGRKSSPIVTRTPVSRVAGVMQSASNDSEIELFYYTSPNRGDHRVIGGHVFPDRISGFNMIRAEGGGYRIDYGYHGGGEPKPFLVHIMDARAQPGYFQKASIRREAPPVVREEPKEPKPIENEKFFDTSPDNIDPLASFANKEPVIKNLKIESRLLSEEELDEIYNEFDPQTIPGITTGIARQLTDMGMDSIDKLKSMTRDQWLDLRGVADTKADMIMGFLAKTEE